jgi:sterol 3beta-glucosyltransferase
MSTSPQLTDFTEAIEVKVLDEEEFFSFDSYLFAYFHDLPGLLQDIRDAVRSHQFA